MKLLPPALLALTACVANAQTPPSDQALFRSIYKELVEINTTDSAGDATRAARAMAARLKAGGFKDSDIHIIVPPGAAKKGNLVARLKGTGARKPILLLAHLDVVEAKREDWTRNPFKLVEENGVFYARGSVDDKSMAAAFVANMIRMKREGFRPEGGRGIVAPGGKYLFNGIEAAEKVFQTYRLEVTNPGGHSALPSKDNAIYHLADGLARLGKFDFPVKLSEITRTYFERASKLQAGPLAEDMRAILREPPDAAAIERLSRIPLQNAQMRTTCVATMLEAGHATNALPQRASAVVNCRILPGEPVDEVRATLVRVLADDRIGVTPDGEPVLSPPAPLAPEIMRPVERITEEMWPGVPVIPIMLPGATDGRFLDNAGIPTYGISGQFRDAGDSGVHGLNEHIPAKALYQSREFLDRLVKALSSPE
jgi:acetylornithine deacetylase/succinyl-diaminopimelate desuccinylase-like protein